MTILSLNHQLRELHAKVMIGVVGLVCLTSLVSKPDNSLQLTVLMVGVGTIGLAHGAMDHRVGELLLRDRFQGLWPVVFGSIYLVLTTSLLLAWAIVPTLALVIFLVYSSLHFGSDPREGRGPAVSLICGSLPILLPVAFHGEEVSMIFSHLAGQNIDINPFLPWITLACITAVLVLIGNATRKGSLISGAETISLVILNYATPPLLAFAVYFVLLHSVRHLIDLADWLEPADSRRGFFRIARESLPLTALTLVGMGVGVMMLGTADVGPSVLKVIFITLSALTVPHMIFTSLASRSFTLVRNRKPLST